MGLDESAMLYEFGLSEQDPFAAEVSYKRLVILGLFHFSQVHKIIGIHLLTFSHK